ncbi:Fused protease/ribonucleoside-triphosphate reductase [uncultured virus]|nr:Fused protease/ribonucleoside-triphosphate reductase [uncultured virus]
MADHCYINKTISDRLLIAEEYRLPENFVTDLKLLKVPFISDIAQCTFYRTYSRKLPNGGNERWADTIIRVIEGTMSAYITHMKRNHLEVRDDIDEFAKDMAISAFNRRWLPPGRGLYCMGTDFVKYRGNAALNNCYAVSTKMNMVKAAAWGMDMLMCGGGVGFDVSWMGGAVRPNKEDNFVFVIPDSRQGWVAALELLLRAYIPINKVITNKFPIFDFSLIRPYGAPIKGFGGTASGPEPLRVLLKRIEAFTDSYIDYCEDSSKDSLKRLYENQIRFLQKHQAYNVVSCVDDVEPLIDNVNKSIDLNYNLKAYNEVRYVTDVFNAIASCVVAGNVRRSSEIAIGDTGSTHSEDLKCHIFINLKNYEINPERSPWGWNSNNTVRFHKNEDFEKWIPIISPLIKVNGEPGIFNLINVKRFGRFSDTSRPPDEATLVNPCGEIVLCSYEPCTLSIICPYNCREDMTIQNSPLNEDMILKAGEYATFYASVVTTIPHHWQESNAIIARNRRIGVSFAGITNIYENYGQNRLITIARHLYHHVSNVNKKFADHAGIPTSIRITTIKPEGTTSLITELNPGIHFSLMQYCIRRIVVSDISPLVSAFEEAGYVVEDSVYTPNTKVICIPLYSGNGRSADQVSLFEQFGLLMSMQRHWSDNSCSDTITFNKETEGDTVHNAISMFIPHLKTVSLLGKDPSGAISCYKQLPYENISREQYENLMSRLKPINWDKLYDIGIYDGVDQKYCTNDSCSL